MARIIESPFICHVFVCAFDREGKKKSCADHNSPEVRKALKEEVANRGWKKHVRVSQSGCLGACDNGPVVIIYPQNIWFSEVSTGDAGLILAKVKELLGEKRQT
ncbi:MAG: (2Fe-2S) ferredoxin domain-containing protein [Nitrospirae bacterium]|nr:(2Fe-2S) ferredoxin domain-containing protein [Nitrospirota bacterium]